MILGAGFRNTHTHGPWDRGRARAGLRARVSRCQLHRGGNGGGLAGALPPGTPQRCFALKKDRHLSKLPEDVLSPQ